MLSSRERQADISTMATRVGHVAVSELAIHYAVTPETIRRDLKTLESLGLVTRVHGGAVATHEVVSSPSTPAFGVRQAATAHVPEKHAIARKALELLPEGTVSLFIDSGSTTAEFVRALTIDAHSHAARFTIVTTSISIAALCSELGLNDVHVIAGRLRPFTKVLVGDQTVSALQSLRADIAILGASGITVDHGFSTPDPAEATVKSTMVAGARRSIVLADSSKLGKDCLVTYAPVDLIDTLVTDNHADPDQLAQLGEHQLKVVQAS